MAPLRRGQPKPKASNLYVGHRDHRAPARPLIGFYLSYAFRSAYIAKHWQPHLIAPPTKREIEAHSSFNSLSSNKTTFFKPRLAERLIFYSFAPPRPLPRMVFDKSPSETSDHLTNRKKRLHKKSKTGCNDCRKRRVKACFSYASFTMIT